MARECELISPEQVRPDQEKVHRTYFGVFVEDIDRVSSELQYVAIHRLNGAPDSSSCRWKPALKRGTPRTMVCATTAAMAVLRSRSRELAT